MTVQQTSLSPVSARPAQSSNGLHAAILLAAGMLALYPHFQIGALFGPVCFAWLLVITLFALFMSSELAFSLLIVSLFFQNTLISVVSPDMKDPGRFSALLGTSFAVTVLIACFSAPLWLQLRQRLGQDSRDILKWLVIFSVVIVAYTGLGAASADLMSAILYARTYFSGILLLVIGVAMGFKLSPAYVSNLVRVTAALLAVWGFVEFCSTYDLYSLFNVSDFLRLKWVNYPDAVFANVADAVNFDNHPYLNLSGAFGLDFTFLRPKGPNIHPISYGYSLAFCCLVCFMYRYYISMFACLALVFLVGAKGPMLLSFMSIVLALYYGQNLNKKRLLFILTTCLLLYLVGGLAYGIISSDYHVIGFMGGVHGFLRNPLGRGVGVGGNVSSLAIEKTDFTMFQNYGADFALESALGVMLFQMGIGTLVFLIFYWHVGKSVWKAVTVPGADPRLIVVPIALAFLSINSVFQEEALSPCGWGLWLLLGGLLLSNHWKRQLGLTTTQTG